MNEFKPELEDFLAEGLSLTQACMGLEAYSSCAIEGAKITKSEFKSLCKKIRRSFDE